MNRTYLIVALVVTASGCQAARVQKNSNKLSSTVPDLYYGQVLDNMAMFVNNPTATPYFSYPAQGTTANTLTAQASYTPGWDFIATLGHYVFDRQSALIQGANADAQTFQVTPVISPDKLILMRTAYRIASGDPYVSYRDRHNLWYFHHSKLSATTVVYADYYKAITGISVVCEPKPNDGELLNDPCEPQGNQNLYVCKCQSPSLDACKRPDCPDCGDGKYVPQRAEWFHTACRKKDIPKHVCYWGRYCDVYLWVPPGEMNAFTAFTLAILDIATVGGDQTIKVKFDDKLSKALESLADDLKCLIKGLPEKETAMTTLRGLKANPPQLAKFLENLTSGETKSAPTPQEIVEAKPINGLIAALRLPDLRGFDEGVMRFDDKDAAAASALVADVVKQKLLDEVTSRQEQAAIGTFDVSVPAASQGAHLIEAIHAGLPWLREQKMQRDFGPNRRADQPPLELGNLEKLVSKWGQFQATAQALSRQSAVQSATPTFEYLITPRVSQFPYPAPPSPP